MSSVPYLPSRCLPCSTPWVVPGGSLLSSSAAAAAPKACVLAGKPLTGVVPANSVGQQTAGSADHDDKGGMEGSRCWLGPSWVEPGSVRLALDASGGGGWAPTRDSSRCRCGGHPLIHCASQASALHSSVLVSAASRCSTAHTLDAVGSLWELRRCPSTGGMAGALTLEQHSALSSSQPSSPPSPLPNSAPRGRGKGCWAR